MNKKTLFKYKFCKRKTEWKIRLLNLISHIRAINVKIVELQKKLNFLDLRIRNIEYFMEKIELKESKQRKFKYAVLDFLYEVIHSDNFKIITRVILFILIFILFLRWAESVGMKEDILKILLGVTNG